MGLAIAMKISALLFVPPFLLCLVVWEYRSRRVAQTIFAVCVAMVVLSTFTWGISWSLKQYAHAGFYPVEQIHKAYAKMQQTFAPKQSAPVAIRSSPEKKDVITPYEVEIIANHPGDLRIQRTILFTEGGVLWLVVLVGGLTIGITKCRRRTQRESLESPLWFFGVGIWYVILTGLFTEHRPGCPVLSPGIPFSSLLPFAEGFSRLPRFKILLVHDRGAGYPPGWPGPEKDLQPASSFKGSLRGDCFPSGHAIESTPDLHVSRGQLPPFPIPS